MRAEESVTLVDYYFILRIHNNLTRSTPTRRHDFFVNSKVGFAATRFDSFIARKTKSPKAYAFGSFVLMRAMNV